MRVHRAVDDLDLTIKEIRSTIYALQSPLGVAVTLRGRILEVVDAAAEQLGFAPSLRMGGLLDTSVSSERADQVVAVLREALSNAARHSGAAQVDVEVLVLRDERGPGETLSVAVKDDGSGVPEGGRRSGLANLESRARALGGTFVVGAGPLGGTDLRWEVPLEP